MNEGRKHADDANWEMSNTMTMERAGGEPAGCKLQKTDGPPRTRDRETDEVAPQRRKAIPKSPSQTAPQYNNGGGGDSGFQHHFTNNRIGSKSHKAGKERCVFGNRVKRNLCSVEHQYQHWRFKTGKSLTPSGCCYVSTVSRTLSRTLAFSSDCRRCSGIPSTNSLILNGPKR